MEICMDQYIRKIITTLEHHFKPIQNGIIKNKGYNGHHNIEGLTPLPAIELIFLATFVCKTLTE